METRKRERYGWLDVMKLFAIWLIYTTHYDGMGRFGLLGQFSALGILFFASGFTAFTRKDRPWKGFLLEKAQRLLVPYFAFGVLTLAVRVFLFELSIGDMIDWMKRLVWGARNVCPVAAMWFLPCLFFMSIYYQALQKLLKNNRWALLGVSFLISAAVKFIHEGPVLPWGIDMAGRFLIYYALGDFASGLWRAWKQKGTVPRPALAAGLVLAGVSFYIFYINFYYGLGYFPSLFGVQEASFAVLSGITLLYQCSAIVCAACVGLALQRLPLLCRMGQMTLVFCCTEQIVKVVLPLLFAAVGLTLPDSGTQVGGAAMALQAMGMLLAAYYGLAVPLAQHFPWMLGRFQKTSGGEGT